MADSLGSQGAFLASEKTVSTPGAAEALGSGLWGAIVVIAKAGNTGQVYIGGSDVSSSTNDGLDAGDSLPIRVSRGKEIRLADIFIDVDTGGEGVDIYATW